jgi:glutathione S-transferase
MVRHMGPASVELRYFGCRGRGQALRYALIDAGVDFADVVFQADQSWPEHKASPGISGPFSALPLLIWGDHRVAQTLAIAAYISRQLGQYAGRADDEIAGRESVTSAAYLDFTSLVSELFRPRLVPVAEQWSLYFSWFIPRITARPAGLERLLATSAAPFFGGTAPVVADYFVFEALDVWLELLGAPFEQVLQYCPRLRQHRATLAARPALAAYLASGRRPSSLTASPLEPEIRERLSEHVSSLTRAGAT